MTTAATETARPTRQQSALPPGMTPLNAKLRHPVHPETERSEASESREREQGEKGERDGHEPRPDHPGEAMQFRLLSLRDENGYIPPDGLQRAKEHVQTMRAAEAPDGPATAGITNASWTWRGPGNIGGRTRAIAINPGNASVIFAGTVGGGIWKTTDAGANWAPVNDFMADLAVTAIVYQPGSTTVMYAGTGEGFFNGDAIRGAGIFKSIDGGTTWNQIASTANSNFFYVNRLAFSADGSILLAATETGVWRSVDGGTSWGVTAVLAPANSGFGGTVATDVKFLPGSNTLAVAAAYNGLSYWSNNGGASFTAATGFSGTSSYGASFTRVELAVSPSAPSSVYAVLDAPATAGTPGGKFYKSIDNGVSFTLVSIPAHLSGQGWYDNAMWVDPTTDNNIVVGGLDLWRSTNNGVSWTRISSWQFAPNSAHADHHVIVNDVGYNGTSNTRVYFGNDGGVYKADNVLTVTNASGGGFSFLNHNLGATQFYGAAGNASTGRITGGTQDNGDLFYTTAAGAQGWVDRYGGDGGFSAYDPTDANVFYGEYVDLAIHRNTNGVTTNRDSQDIWGYSTTTGTCKPAPYQITDTCAAFNYGGTGGANFIAPFILDPNNPNTMLAGGFSLWRSNDVKAPLTGTTGPQWAAIKASAGSPINAIAVAPGNSDIIYVGYNSGDVYMTPNGTAVTPTWFKVDSAAMPNSQVQRIAIDPHNGNNVYVAFGGFVTNNLWRSIDGGVSWNPSSGSGGTALPAVPVRGIAIHPNVAGWIYAGTEVGVFASQDGGATWHVPQDGPANVSVDELSWMGPTLIAATHGRGVFTAVPIVVVPTIGFIDYPAPGATLTGPFPITGWSLNQGAPSGTGVDMVHLYAYPSGGGAPTFIGVATYGQPRPDVGAIYGAQFTNCGWSTVASSLVPGSYNLVAFAHNTVTGSFDPVQARAITVAAPPSRPIGSIDIPFGTVRSTFLVAGWAIDLGAPSGTGIDQVHVYAYPSGGGPPTFLGLATYGAPRPDVGGIFGAQFTNSGYSLNASALAPGNYTLAVFIHSTVSGTFTPLTRAFTVKQPGTPLMSIDTPGAGASLTQPFVIAGWAADLDAASGTGVDAIHVWAYPTGGGAAIFVGIATLGYARPDVGAVFGAQFTNSGYNVAVAGGTLPVGSYTLVAFLHSTVTGAFTPASSVAISIH